APAAAPFQRSAAPPASIPADDKAGTAPAANSPWTSTTTEQSKSGGSLAPGRMFQSSQSSDASAPKTFGSPANDSGLVPIKSAAAANAAASSAANSANAALTNNATTNTSSTP